MEWNWTGLLLLLWLCVSATCDALFRKIYNYVLLFGLVVYFLLWNSDSELTASFLSSLAGSLIAFICFLLFYIFNLMGAGDVKFGAVLGLILGWKLLISVWVLSCFFAVIHGFYDKGFRRSLLIVSEMSLGDARKIREKSIPYVTYLSIATVIVLMLWK